MSVKNVLHSKLEIPEVVIPAPELLTVAFAHEIRNPLTTINLATELLNELITDEEQKQFLDMILRASAKITEQVNAFVKNELPEELVYRKYSIHHLLEEVLLLTNDRLLLKNIIVTKNFTPRDYVKTIDMVGMQIALTNLIINAIDAMSPNGQLKLTTKSIKGNYTIQIEDDGCGISAEDLPNIFLPYVTHKKNGLGIGLAATQAIFICNKIVVKVTSVVGKGTKFTLTFAKERSLFLVHKL